MFRTKLYVNGAVAPSEKLTKDTFGAGVPHKTVNIKSLKKKIK